MYSEPVERPTDHVSNSSPFLDNARTLSETWTSSGSGPEGIPWASQASNRAWVGSEKGASGETTQVDSKVQEIPGANAANNPPGSDKLNSQPPKAKATGGDLDPPFAGSKIDTKDHGMFCGLTSGSEKVKKGSNLTHKLLNKIIHREAEKHPEKEECLACTEEFPTKQIVTTTCEPQHKYCHACFERLILTGCENEASFPPKCCQKEIPSHLIRKNVPKETLRKYSSMNKLASIPFDSRWYCPYAQCGRAFNVKRATVTRHALRCPSCSKPICVSCKQQAHKTNSECKDDSLEATMQTTRENGWRTCYRCKEMVELQSGCRHVICRCGAHFCYGCGKRNNSCTTGQLCLQKVEEVKRIGEFGKNNQVRDDELREGVWRLPQNVRVHGAGEND